MFRGLVHGEFSTPHRTDEDAWIVAMMDIPDGARDGQAIREWWRWARMGAAISAGTPDGAQFAAIGNGSYLAFPQGVLHGQPRIRIGEHCVINEHVTLSAGPITPDQHTDAGAEEPTDLGDAVITLGSRVVLGRGTEILAMTSVVLDDDVWTASRVTIADHNHRHDQPDVPVALQEPLDVRPVSVGAGTVLSTGVTVLAGARIGARCLVAAGAVVRAGDYSDGCVLAGVPARIVHRNPDHSIPTDLPRHPAAVSVQRRTDAYLEAVAAAGENPCAQTYRTAAWAAMDLSTAYEGWVPGTTQSGPEARLGRELMARANRYQSAAVTLEDVGPGA